MAISNLSSPTLPPLSNMAACPFNQLRLKLRQAGLRPTRQRILLGWLLFAKGARHITAEQLYEEARESQISIALATVYNTLHQFTEAGLLQSIAIDGSKTYFDTNVAHHHHFLIEETGALVDMSATQITLTPSLNLPEDMEISSVHLLVKVRQKVSSPRTHSELLGTSQN